MWLANNNNNSKELATLVNSSALYTNKRYKTRLMGENLSFDFYVSV